MKTFSLKTIFLVVTLSFSSVFVNGLGKVMAQKTKDWYAPQNVTMLDKAAYKEITQSFRKKSVKLAFHFEKCKWNIQRLANYEFFKDSVNLRDLMSDFEDVVVNNSRISKCEITPLLSHHYMHKVTLHYMS